MQINRTQFFQNSAGSAQAARREADRQNARQARRMLSESRLSEQSGRSENGARVFQGVSQNSVVGDNLSYAEGLRVSRTKAKDTSLKLKQLRYDFKSISTQILRSKTSVSARQVASKARREVIRLKRLRQNGEYDDEELQSAITHAQAMERVAKKKARHLEEEEMVKTGGTCEGDLEEKAKDRDELQDTAETEDAQQGDPKEEWQEAANSGELMQDQMGQYREMMEAMARELQAMVGMNAGNSMDSMMSDMMDDMWESMKSMMEDLGLDDLADGMLASPDQEMDPADLKMMKIKHRTKEMKAIAEADSEYLKAMFEKYQREKAAGGASFGGSASFSGGSGMPSMGEAAQVAGVAMPMAMPGGFSGGGIDISI